MNDTGGGVTAIHDVPGDITRIGFHWMLLFFLSVTRSGLLFVLHTECLGGHGVSLSRICEFSNCFFTRNVAEVKDFLCPDFFYLVPNYRIIEYLSHGMSRRSRGFFVTNFRIFEFFLHTEGRGDHGFSLSRDLSLDPLANGR